jgi:hypothetical protein
MRVKEWERRRLDHRRLHVMLQCERYREERLMMVVLSRRVSFLELTGNYSYVYDRNLVGSMPYFNPKPTGDRPIAGFRINTKQEAARLAI